MLFVRSLAKTRASDNKRGITMSKVELRGDILPKAGADPYATGKGDNYTMSNFDENELDNMTVSNLYVYIMP